jgi:hypothetical protein
MVKTKEKRYYKSDRRSSTNAVHRHGPSPLEEQITSREFTRVFCCSRDVYFARLDRPLVPKLEWLYKTVHNPVFQSPHSSLNHHLSLAPHSQNSSTNLPPHQHQWPAPRFAFHIVSPPPSVVDLFFVYSKPPANLQEAKLLVNNSLLSKLARPPPLFVSSLPHRLLSSSLTNIIIS